MFKSIPLTVLSLTLGFFFVFVGLLKVTPEINPTMHNDLRNEFGRYNKVFPFEKLTGWKPFAKNYRLFVGYTEIVCGSILILIPGALKTLATLTLLGIMLGGYYTHFALNDKFERSAPSLIFALLLTCRLVINYQVNRRVSKEDRSQIKTEASATTTTTATKKRTKKD